MRKEVTLIHPANSKVLETNASPEKLASPQGILSISVLVLAAIAVVGALYVGKEVVLPIVLALVLKLMLQPIMNTLCERLRLPHAFSALLLIICRFGVVAAVALTISVPASAWIQKIPKILPSFSKNCKASNAQLNIYNEPSVRSRTWPPQAGTERPQWQ